MSNGNNIVQKNNSKANNFVLTMIMLPVLFGVLGGIFWAIGAYISVGLSFCLFTGIVIGLIASAAFYDSNKWQ